MVGALWRKMALMWIDPKETRRSGILPVTDAGTKEEILDLLDRRAKKRPLILTEGQNRCVA